MKPAGRHPIAFRRLVLIIAVVAIVTACTESPTPTIVPTPLPTPTLTPEERVSMLEERIEALVTEARLIRDDLVSFAGVWGLFTEFGNIQLAIDAAIADLGLSTVDAHSTCNDFGSSGGCGLTGGTVPADFLYPDYLNFQLPEDGRTYSWDTTGLVEPQPQPASSIRLRVVEKQLMELETEIGLIRHALRYSAQDVLAPAIDLEDIQTAIDTAIADLSLITIEARSNCRDFSSSGGCGLTGGTVPADFLYPSYLSIQTARDGHTYSWDSTGLVTTP